MCQPLLKNSYHILGLDPSASQQAIRKRTNDLLKLVQIDEVPKYPTDLIDVVPFRNETEIKLAQKNVTEPTTRVRESFFWFSSYGNIDEQAITALGRREFQIAFDLWEKTLKNEDPSVSLLRKKNLALAQMLQMYLSDTTSLLQRSTALWHDVITSSLFWDVFKKSYFLSEDLGSDPVVIDEFRTHVVGIVLDCYTELFDKFHNPQYISMPYQTFNIVSPGMDQIVLKPIFEKILAHCHHLSLLKSENATDTPIEQLIRPIISEFSQLKALGLYDASQTKMLRDKASESIKSVYVYLYEKEGETDRIQLLIKTAKALAATSGANKAVENDIEVIENNKFYSLRVVPIEHLMSEKRWEMALVAVEKLLLMNDLNSVIKANLLSIKKNCLSNVVLTAWMSAKTLFDKGQVREARSMWSDIERQIKRNLGMFDYNSEKIQSVIDEFYKVTYSAEATHKWELVDQHREIIRKAIEENFKGEWEEYILLALFDSISWGRIAELKLAATSSESVPLRNTSQSGGGFEKLIGWVILFVVYLAIRACSS